jgi:hypothetical protein
MHSGKNGASVIEEALRGPVRLRSGPLDSSGIVRITGGESCGLGDIHQLFIR